MACQAGPVIEPVPSALKASAFFIELMWQTIVCLFRCWLLFDEYNLLSKQTALLVTPTVTMVL